MLKTIDPLLTGRVLDLLDRMGHGDVLGLVDRNFPAYRYRVPVIDLHCCCTPRARPLKWYHHYYCDPPLRQRPQGDNSDDQDVRPAG